MQIPAFIDPAPGEIDEMLAHQLGLEMVESAAFSPTQGRALLRAGAIFAAYLATHEREPERTASILVAEFSGNVHICLERLRGAQADAV